MTNLFQSGKFTLASGEDSDFKIECDALTDEDWDGLANKIVDLVHPFDLVLGVPRGGLKLQIALTKHRRRNKSPELPLHVLIVDDVWTTGESMSSFRDSYRRLLPGSKFEGAVAFSRGVPDMWVQSLFQMQSVKRTSSSNSYGGRGGSSSVVNIKVDPPPPTLLKRIKKALSH